MIPGYADNTMRSPKSASGCYCDGAAGASPCDGMDATPHRQGIAGPPGGFQYGQCTAARKSPAGIYAFYAFARMSRRRSKLSADQTASRS